jgi:uncharacterized phiE125 gp8 family phage protein
MVATDRAPPAAALEELKAFLRIETSLEDALLTGFLRAATEAVEAMLGLILFERGVTERGLLSEGGMRLAVGPMRSLVSVETVGTDGTLSAAPDDAARLLIGTHGEGRIDAPQLPEEAGVQVRYRAGWATDWNGVPEVLRLCVIRTAAHFHAHRDSPDGAGVPPAVLRMLGPWRTRRIR